MIKKTLVKGHAKTGRIILYNETIAKGTAVSQLHYLYSLNRCRLMDIGTSHFKYKTIGWTSQVYNRDPYTKKTVFS